MAEQGREPGFSNWMSAPLEGFGSGNPGAYPGLGGEMAETNAFVGSPAPAAFSPVQVMPAAPQQPAAASPAKGLLGNFNLNDLKGMLDRMGGVEGLLSNVGKIQKFMTTFQQVAPLIKLFMGKKGGSSTDNESSGSYRPRRRRRRRRSSSKPGARRTGSRRKSKRSSAKRRK